MGIEPLQSSGSVVRYSTYPKYWVEKERREKFHSQSSATKNLVALDLGKSDLLETIGNEKFLPPPTAKLKLTFFDLGELFEQPGTLFSATQDNKSQAIADSDLGKSHHV